MGHARIEGPAGHLYVDIGGSDGEPVVFLHSYAGSSAHWSAQLAHLRPQWRTVAFDFRGHGQSDAPHDDDYAVESLTEDLETVIQGLALERFVLVGHSMGGVVAIAYAGSHPDNVTGLLLVGTPGKTPPEQARQIMSSMQADYEKVTQGYWDQLLKDGRPQVKAMIRRDMEKLSRKASLSIIQAIFDFDPLPPLAAYRGPKLAVNTRHGDSPNALEKLVPDMPHKQIAGTSHWPHMDKPDEFNRILDEFLAAVPEGHITMTSTRR